MSAGDEVVTARTRIAHGATSSVFYDIVSVIRTFAKIPSRTVVEAVADSLIIEACFLRSMVRIHHSPLKIILSLCDARPNDASSVLVVFDVRRVLHL